MRLDHIVFIGLILFGLTGCNQTVGKEGDLTEISFFYWKSTFNVKDVSSRWVDSIPVKKLYIRFFDIDIDVNQGPVPVAPLTGLPKKLPYSLTPSYLLPMKLF